MSSESYAVSEFDPNNPAREVTVTELDRNASRVVERVRQGEVAVVSRHGRAIALIVPIEDGRALLPPDLGADDRPLGELAKKFERRQVRREWSALMHGRWYGKRYRRYRYRPDR